MFTSQCYFDEETIEHIVKRKRAGAIEEPMWRKIIEKIYEPEDQERVVAIIKEEIAK